ncbi:Homeobox-leucine zipper protein ATHB-7 [Abeliophyllum distichum]|uniref:Homeobox-leucine zipper protein n=1 Tax=Abeliophyllum distichum TaxID=126358 RepID=A0ABD1RQF6_9LAMI
METMFETETQLEPKKKMQLAKELGLQPRQVAIWFQNKRARWKSKKLERDYSTLLDNYNNLVSQIETLKKEKQVLVIQLQKLNDMVGKSEMEIKCPKQEISSNRMDGESSDNGENKRSDEFEVPNTRLCLDRSENEENNYFGLEEETELMNMVESADSSLESHEDLLNHNTGGYQWWDFWSGIE